MNEIIEFNYVSKEESYVPRENSYEFTSVGKYQWLKKLIWKWLLKEGCLKLTFDKQYVFKRYTVDKQEFLKAIISQKVHLLERYNHQGQTLIIGTEDYYSLLQQADDPTSPLFRFRTEFMRGGEGIIGLEVKVVPWVKGMVVI